jgi:hypothetical protein
MPKQRKQRGKINLDAPPADDSDLDEGAPDLSVDGDQITVSKDYIKRLRQEAAARRVQVRTYTDAFGKYNEGEVAWMLDTAELLIDNPTEAVARYRELVNLYDPDGNAPAGDTHPGKGDEGKKEKEPVVAGQQDKDNGETVQLTRTELNQMLESAKKDIHRDVSVEQIRREMTARAKSLGFEPDTPNFHTFMGMVHSNNGDFDAAHTAYKDFVKAESDRLTEKVELNEQFPSRGRGPGPVMPPHEPPKDFAQAREAAEAFFASQAGQ